MQVTHAETSVWIQELDLWKMAKTVCLTCYLWCPEIKLCPLDFVFILQDYNHHVTTVLLICSLIAQFAFFLVVFANNAAVSGPWRIGVGLKGWVSHLVSCRK